MTGQPATPPHPSGIWREWTEWAEQSFTAYMKAVGAAGPVGNASQQSGDASGAQQAPVSESNEKSTASHGFPFGSLGLDEQFRAMDQYLAALEDATTEAGPVDRRPGSNEGAFHAGESPTDERARSAPRTSRSELPSSTTGLAQRPPSAVLLWLEWRAVLEFSAHVVARPLLSMLPRGDGHPVLVLPGFGASDESTAPLRSVLNDLGYVTYGWGRGDNLGLRAGVREHNAALLEWIWNHHETPVSLVGWSLGGLYARQLANLYPERVRDVITLGSPFTGSPWSNNVWMLYEAAAGHSIDDPGMQRSLFERAPSVPTTSVYSRSDGVVNWRCCVNSPGPHCENVEVLGSHCGLGFEPSTLCVIADRLAQQPATWRPFRRKNWLPLPFPDPDRPGAG